MKTLVTILCFLSINLMICQEKKVYVEYEITNLSIGKPIYVKAKLFIDGNTSLYTVNPKETKYTKKEKVIYKKENNSIKKIIYKLNKNILFLFTNKDSLKHSFASGGNFIVKEKKYPFNWKLVNETKKIGNFLCYKATTYFRGRNYIAWYTTKIPVNKGPWKFSGLPGLILEVSDYNNLYLWKPKTIEYPYNGKVSFKIPEKESFSNIELKDYINIRDGNSKKSSNLFKSKLPKGSKIRDLQVKRSGIELIYEWEETEKEN